MLLSPESIALLPALVALLETESVTVAAERLGVGQPAMSRTLARLREHLGDPLLVRVGRNVVRTKRGEALLPRARESLGLAARVLEREAPFVPGEAKGAVSLALGEDVAAMLATPLLLRIRRSAPGLDLRIHVLSVRTLDQARRGAVELAIAPDLGRERGMPDLAEFVKRPLYTRRFVTVTRRRVRMDLDRFCRADHVLVTFAGDESGYVDESLRAIGRARRVAVTVPSFQAAIAIVSRSDLVATLPDDVVRGLAPKLTHIPCPVPTPALPMCLLWHARSTTDPRHRWLRAEVEAVARTLGAESAHGGRARLRA